ncbi:MAG: VRR-NUC domain-containing protein [Leadbetterella sp.]|nr:VRR-NUC domain-containing protein [Leadbetterella sp.]
MSAPELPPKYYHDNFEYLLSFVKDKYADLLVEPEWRFLRKYYTLPEDAQCLFIRFTNRKGLFFKVDTLKYAEIEDIPDHLELLKARGFITPLNFEDHKFWINELLALLTRNELSKVFEVRELKAARKEEIITHLKTVREPEEIIDVIRSSFHLVKVNFEEEVSFLKFLFFGNRSMDMTEFVLRDLGLIQYYRQSDDDLVARFTTRKEAEDKWLVSEQFLVFSEIRENYTPEQVFDWYCSFRDANLQLSPIAIPAFRKLQLNIGRHLERCKTYDLAVELYEDAEVPPARERKARCMAKAKFYDEARAVCEEMIRSPFNVDEQYFAEYFLTSLSGKKNRKQTTVWLKEADEITVSADYRYSVELGSLEYFLEQGYTGAFSENFSWRALFGLLLWDIIFDPSLVAFHHPFQRRPSDLYLPDFYEKRETQVQQRLEEFPDPDELINYLWGTFEKNFGTANPFVVWDPEIWGMVKVLASRIPLPALKKIIQIMAENLVENSRGMPDLLIWNDSRYELLEIKSPNDTLSHQQLFWLKTFQELGVNARVLRVRFSS